jgi:hypothetical protein
VQQQAQELLRVAAGAGAGAAAGAEAGAGAGAGASAGLQAVKAVKAAKIATSATVFFILNPCYLWSVKGVATELLHSSGNVTAVT